MCRRIEGGSIRLLSLRGQVGSRRASENPAARRVSAGIRRSKCAVVSKGVCGDRGTSTARPLVADGAVTSRLFDSETGPIWRIKLSSAPQRSEKSYPKPRATAGGRLNACVWRERRQNHQSVAITLSQRSTRVSSGDANSPGENGVTVRTPSCERFGLGRLSRRKRASRDESDSTID